jgi:hypothetical protein
MNAKSIDTNNAKEVLWPTVSLKTQLNNDSEWLATDC